MKKATIATATAGIAVTAFAAPTIASASTVVVESGDTLWGIAESNDTTVDSLKKLNSLDSDKIFPGQKLVVSETSKENTEKAVSATWLNVRQGPGVENNILTSLKGGTKVTVLADEANGWNKISYGEGKTGYVNGKYLGEAKVAPAPSATQQTEVKQTTQTNTAETTSVKENTAVQKPANLSTYKVKNGDTLWALSVKFNSSVQELMSWNHLSSSSIYVGQTLAVKAQAAQPATPVQKEETAVAQPAEKQEAETAAPAETATTEQPAVQAETEQAKTEQVQVDVNASSYTVQKGDSLSKIAGLFGTTVSQLKALNGLSSDAIVVGDVLKVKGEVKQETPVKEEAPAQTETKPVEQTQTEKPAQTAPSTPKEETAPAAPVIDTSASSYTVRSGDSLSKIAGIFGTTVSKIKALNGLSSDNIQVGQVLKVKGTVPQVSNNNSNSSSNVSNANNSSSNNASKPAQNTNSGSSSSASNTGSSSSSSSASYGALIAEAQKHLGKPYGWGANGPSSFDCSGYTKYVFNKVGISLPRTSGGQYAAATKISESQAKPGDLVFFNYGSGIAHVGIYVGGGQMINAQDNGVKYDNIHGSGWGQFLVGFGRVANF
ncbi:invasion associated secreted endopeptidase [Listeria floridensis FSL S10-1187]|uniref:Probable endopeptidase p60 n=1 Tax=Listeria floridensis FSL S10-1187 TaxID=1265817 RepID=A0ABP3AZ60_9LIST|nr:LysM peptidoglycan-binding domain-containing protein [Listeria floridensis]EUJ30543.1 invasion associated secreted endopeptidase [Listeria floridensis FSL S10-1187]